MSQHCKHDTPRKYDDIVSYFYRPGKLINSICKYLLAISNLA